MVIEALLNSSIDGVGKFHKTSIFPCGIFQSMEGVNRKLGDPNYDLYKLALKSTAQRLYPNYANVNWSGNAGYDIDNPLTYFTTMGALDRNEHLMLKVDGEVIDCTIEDFFNYCKSGEFNNARPAQIFYNSKRLSIPGDKSNQSTPYGITPGPAVYAITYKPMDVTYIGSSGEVAQRFREYRSNIRRTGGLDAGPSFGDDNIDNYEFTVLEYTEDYKEAEKKYILSEANINCRSTSQKFYKLKTHTHDVFEKPTFTFDPTIPQELINLDDRDIMVLDQGNRWVKVRHIFKNHRKNSPLMMHVYYNELGKEYCLSCTQDHPLWTGSEFTKAEDLKAGMNLYRADGMELKVIKVTWHWEQVDSYDIGTETGSFIGSDIIMHNCRTANGYDINAEDPKLVQIKDGRGNISPVTVIWPTLAMQAKENVDNSQGLSDDESKQNAYIDEFLKILDKKLIEAKDMLLERFDWQCSQSERSASFMYENNTMLGYKPEEGIKSALKHGTLAIGFIGVAEALQILIGKDQTTKEGQEVAEKLLKAYSDKVAEFKKKEHLNFTTYATPAENLCFTSLQRFKAKYGEIPNVSDKEFFTNSFHVPVWQKVSPFEKIDIESRWGKYAQGGCILYTEFDSSVKNNLEALETIVNYAMDHDVQYFAVNVPNDTCEDCGYCDDIDDTCPQCGGDNIMRLRRVTGYLSTTYEHFNLGKQDEVKHRYKHSNDLNDDFYKHDQKQ